MIKEIKIYDLDGCVIDSSHRYRTNTEGTAIDLDYWIRKDVPEEIARDSLLPMADQFKQDLLNPEVYVIVATARACIPGDANYVYLETTLGMPNKFIHRKGRDDERKGAHLKIQGIKPLLNLKQFKNAVLTVFEDNASYLKELCDEFNCMGVYVPSVQGQ